MIDSVIKYSNNSKSIEICDSDDHNDDEEDDDINSSGGDISPLDDIFQGQLLIDRTKLRRLVRKQSDLVKPYRSRIWSFVCSTYCSSNNISTLTFDCVPITEFISDDHMNKLPSFVDPHYCRLLTLNRENQRNIEQILWTIANQHPEITFCPLLYPFAALFYIHYQDVIQTLTSLTYLIGAKSSGIGNTCGPRLLPLTRAEMERQACVLIGLTNKFGYFSKPKFFSKHRKKLDKEDEMDECFRDWMKWIFIGLPFEHVVRIMDCFLVEGTEFLYRIGLVLLLMFRSSSPTISFSSYFSFLTADTNTTRSSSSSSFTLDNMLSMCGQIELAPDELISAASRLRGISRKVINKLYSKASNKKVQIRSTLLPPYTPPHHDSDSITTTQNKSSLISSNSLKILESSRLPPSHLKSSIIDRYLLRYLWEWIPERNSIQETGITFCTNIHGSSLQTFFIRNEGVEQSILLIKTVNNEIFGAFCSAPWFDRSRGIMRGQYFGTGESFLFSLKPKVRYYPWVGKHEYLKDPNKNIPPSCQLFMAATSKMITIGAGGGMGIWLDENFTSGKTERCDTFDNEPLCSSREFTCETVEVIGFFSNLPKDI
ncbi:GTPase-activating protein skywalker-like [Brevipalpus obovatus]|uniref:GTPase-activating protein skywalker-like n=1 Tax=Brevipalpus obovatus TaxID=246614 RepID=UPI003D9F8A46